jgi:hypothetical protein
MVDRSTKMVSIYHKEIVYLLFTKVNTFLQIFVVNVTFCR